MKKVPEKIKFSPRTILWTALTILVLLTVITAGFRVLKQALMRGADSFFYPYLKAAAGTDEVSDKSLLLRSNAELAAKVEQLSLSNRELALQSKSAGILLEENRILRQMLKLSGKKDQQFVTAEIILRDPLRFREGFTISKGSRHGIAPGAAVVEVSADGRLLLVGIVSECGARTAKVIMLADESLHISGQVGANGAIGFTHTGTVQTAPGRIRFGMLPVRDDYISGGAVITTGFEKSIPAGLKIGELHFAGVPLSGLASLDYSCELIPAVHPESLRFVSVLKNRSDGE